MTKPELKEELVNRLIDYSQQIVKRNTIAAKKHKLACRRFLNDIKKIPKKNFDFYFDAEEVERFYLWSRMFHHTKGVLANQPIELTDYQLFIVANIFGWKKKESGYRRFRKSYIQVGRKNAKSQLLALITSYEGFLSEEQAECYVAGVSREQSNIVYNEIAMQLRRVPLLKNKFQEAYGRIKHIRSNSIIMPLSKEAKKSGDGKNPSFVVIDEYHAHPSSEIYDVLNSGMAARPNGHICIITTSGFSVAENPCFKEYQYVSKIINPNDPIENEEYFVLICELDEGDDPKLEKNWIKANPIVATYKGGLDFLRSELKAAIDAPEKMNNFLTKNMNVWVQGRANSYLPLDKWKLCEAPFTFEDFRGATCIVGVDLSAKIDLTSMAFIFYKDDLLWVLNHSFMPSDTVEQKSKTDKAPYKRWIEEGHITETPGQVVDYRFLESYLEEKQQTYDLKILEVCADPWNASMFLQNLESKGYLPVEVRQGIQTLGSPTKDFRERVFGNTVRHDGNPVLTWSIGNAVQKVDHNLNIMLDKAKSTERIDPIASVITAHVRSIVLESGLGNLEERILNDDFSF